MSEAVQLTLSLDEIAADIRVVWAETKAHQIAAWEGYYRVGEDLHEARSRFGDDDRGYGRWFAAQEFGFSPSWGSRLRRLYERRDDVTALLGSALPSNGDPGVDAVLKQLRSSDGDREERDARRMTPGGQDAAGCNWDVLTGSFQDRLADLGDGSVDLILTDPPYPAEFAYLWTDLAVHAKRILRPGGILAAMSGKIHLDDRMQRLGAHLQYGWVYAEPLRGGNTRILARHVAQEWKPWVCYSKGPWPSGRIDWHGDLLEGGSRSKSDYRWEQSTGPAGLIVERLTRPGDLVVDPFCGTGTFGVATVQAGRRFIGVEKDAGRVAVATRRIGDAAT